MTDPIPKPTRRRGDPAMLAPARGDRGSLPTGSGEANARDPHAPDSNSWGHRLRRYLVLVLGVAISLAMALTSDRMLRHESAVQNALTRQSLTAGLHTHLSREFGLLQSLKGLFESSEFVTATEFQRFAMQDEQIRNRSTWMRVAWAERLPDHPGVVIAAQDAIAEMMSGRFPIRYLEPQNLGDQLSGFDITANPASLAAMRQATATGMTTLSAPILSALLDQGSAAILAFAPAFRNEPGAGYARLTGFVVGAFAIEGLIGSYLDRSVPEGGLAIRIADGNTTIFARGEIDAGAEALPLRVGDRTWRIQVTASETPLHSAVWVPALVLLFGMSLTVLLYLHLLRIDGEYGRISTQVRAATSELGRANRELAERSAALQALADDLRRTSTEAQLANAAKTMFLANMSHELRTPLNAMIGFSEIISRQIFGADAARYTEYARDIHSSGVHLLGIIEDLLDMSRIELGKLQLHAVPTTLATVVDDVVRLLQHRAREQGVRIVCDQLTALPEMLLDGRAMRQALINLITNAVKFSRAGTVVTISGGRTANGDVTIAVIDQGIGIEEEQLTRIFDPFWQADAMRRQSPEGVGLGLAITRRLVEAHGGSVTAESRKNAGTTMTIRLPHGRIAPHDRRRHAAAG